MSKEKQGMEHVYIDDVLYEKSPMGFDKFLIREGDLKVNLLRYEKGAEIPLHRHSDDKVEKVILRGEITFTDDNGTITLDEGAMYMCGRGALYYSGSVNKDTIIMVIESRDSQIQFPSKD